MANANACQRLNADGTSTILRKTTGVPCPVSFTRHARGHGAWWPGWRRLGAEQRRTTPCIPQEGFNDVTAIFRITSYSKKPGTIPAIHKVMKYTLTQEARTHVAEQMLLNGGSFEIQVSSRRWHACMRS